MRYAAILAIAFSFVTADLRPAEAQGVSSTVMEAMPAPYIMNVTSRCGYHYHFVRGHRAKDGRWIRGHCVQNRH